MSIHLLEQYLPKDLIKYEIQPFLTPSIEQSKEKFKACLKEIEDYVPRGAYKAFFSGRSRPYDDQPLSSKAHNRFFRFMYHRRWLQKGFPVPEGGWTTFNKIRYQRDYEVSVELIEFGRGLRHDIFTAYDNAAAMVAFNNYKRWSGYYK